MIGRLVLLWGFGAILLHVPMAWAGAFLEPPGTGLAILSGTFTGSAASFDARGRVVPVAGYQKFELQAYVEYGVYDWLTLVGAGALDDVAAHGAGARAYEGVGAGEIGPRVRVYAEGPWAVSAQATFRTNGGFGAGDPALIGSHTPEGDARLLLARSLEWWGFPGFVEAQVGGRFRDPALGDDLRVDLTFGIRPVAALLILVQDFGRFASGPRARIGPRPLFASDSQKVQVSAVWDVCAQWSAQLGVFATAFGRADVVERGVMLAAWRRF